FISLFLPAIILAPSTTPSLSSSSSRPHLPSEVSFSTTFLFLSSPTSLFSVFPSIRLSPVLLQTLFVRVVCSSFRGPCHSSGSLLVHRCSALAFPHSVLSLHAPRLLSALRIRLSAFCARSPRSCSSLGAPSSFSAFCVRLS